MRRYTEKFNQRKFFDFAGISGGRSQKWCLHLFAHCAAIYQAGGLQKKQLGSANVAKGAVEKLGQPEVPLRHKKFRHMTIDEKFCPPDQRAVIERKSRNRAETRQ